MKRKPNLNPENYTLPDLLDDPAFLAWLLHPDDQSNAHWADMQLRYPNLSYLIADARKLVLTLKFQQDTMEPAEYIQLWEEIAGETVAKPIVKLWRSLWFKAVLAAAVTLLVIGTGFYFYLNRSIEVVTAYGQTRTLVLPDGSELMLNANSSLRYRGNFGKAKYREVWLKGEAFFKVNHIHRQGKVFKQDIFVVHADKVDIKVLGTTFNVNDRRDKVTVALINGRVSMQIANQPLLNLKPGDLVTYDQKRNFIRQEPGSTKAQVAWKDGIFIFEKLPAEELFNKLQDKYGYKAVFKSPVVKEKLISGSFSAADFDHLLEGISMALNISITKDESLHQLIIEIK
ncbi:FecR domain-containing protein [Pedobacter sp. MR2016-24]|uniref:FecR domain-containing protein n=1 Tax=Pedobacter sp. MR2016-24 TaxID=2994466 RepID=UPI0022476245|nr:FecR domain-containing protein [Pedobacter sp. MR2016-24]MCX2484657.1 FecR domain-containing protein [Pedobacter sp. MR2016-24]